MEVLCLLDNWNKVKLYNLFPISHLKQQASCFLSHFFLFLDGCMFYSLAVEFLKPHQNLMCRQFRLLGGSSFELYSTRVSLFR